MWLCRGDLLLARKRAAKATGAVAAPPALVAQLGPVPAEPAAAVEDPGELTRFYEPPHLTFLTPVQKKTLLNIMAGFEFVHPPPVPGNCVPFG